MRLIGRPIFTRRRFLTAAALIVALPLIGWFGARYSLARWAVHRSLAAAGLEPASFDVQSVALSRLRLTNLSIGSAPWLTVGSVEVTYSLAGLLAGRVEAIDVHESRWTIQARDGAIDWGFVPGKSAGPVTLDIPLDRLDVRESMIRVIANGVTHELPLTAQVTRAGSNEWRFDIAASGDGWQLPEAHGSVRLDPGSENSGGSGSSGGLTRSATIAIGMQTARGVSVSLESAGITGLLESIAGNLTIQSTGSGWSMLGGSLTMNGGTLHAGDLTLTDAHADVVMHSADAVEVTALAATVGDGGTIGLAPFTVNPREPRIQTRLSMNNLSLAQWLPLISSDHATGEGRVSGYADISIDWTTGTPRLEQLSGSLRSDPGHGFIQATDADALSSLLEEQDPRFATDEVMRPVRDRIVDALRDFSFSTLTMDLSRKDDETIALVYLSGFGRHGDDPQGLNLTLDLHAQDAFLDLTSRIVARSRMKHTAESALDRFFNEAPSSEEAHP